MLIRRAFLVGSKIVGQTCLTLTAIQHAYCTLDHKLLGFPAPCARNKAQTYLTVLLASFQCMHAHACMKPDAHSSSKKALAGRDARSP